MRILSYLCKWMEINLEQPFYQAEMMAVEIALQDEHKKAKS
ncbi:hypothetical protein [Desulfotruncus alcoholivorax]|nr:hypothetical protein [Desulfotruncus alcoholivorax]